MKLKEVLQYEKEMMTPFRRKLNKIILIGSLTWMACLIAIVPLMIADEEKNTLLLFIWLGVGLISAAVLACFNPKILRKETKMELDSFSYLFTEPKPLEEDSVTLVEEEILYTLTRQGVRVEIPEKILLQNGEYTGQVFDEVQENTFFLPWENTEIFLATNAQARRVRLALAVFSTDPTMENATLFLPMSEDLFRAVKGLGIEERIKDDSWDYLFYNPQDAFKQILSKGRILFMRDKHTGKLFADENGMYIENQENKD